jgi:3-deoxy-D-manno-octulosonic acid kinase
MTGRAPVFAVPTPHGTWVVRHFVRGGSVATALGDRYLARGTPRPFAEASVSDELRARGLETPRVIAAAVYRAGLFYRGDLVTELVPDAEELAEVLFDDRPAGLAATADRKAALKETGALIHRLGRKGVRHVDLNAKNILVSWSGGVPSVYLLDLDRCRVGTHPVPVGSMVRRLLRSLRKFERRTGLRLPEAETGLLVDAAHGRVS